MNNKIFITGGGGYCGSRLVPSLLKYDYQVTVYDLFYFGNYLPKNSNKLKIINGDIRDIKKLIKAVKGHDIFINLACISNDASFELDEKLSRSVNMQAFEPMVLAAKNSGIKRFIYASSSSVYGVSKRKNVTEENPLVPLTLYNKFKGLCEPILFKYASKNFETVIFRPATVCGYSPRQRFDLSVNILTNHAINNNIIKVFGGTQLRPNLHIKDYCRVIKLLIKAPANKIANQVFNVGNENASITQLAQIVKKIVKKEFRLKKEIKIIFEKSDDKRSYHINSDKIFKILKFKPLYTVEDAIIEICQGFKKKLFVDSLHNINYFNVKKLTSIFNSTK
jgi:nucleoside-diphosphate-sugar epimerase